MKQAIERITKSVETYCEGQLSRSLAKIELVSAFKVISKSLDVDEDTLQNAIESYIDAVLTRLDDVRLSTSQVIDELSRVYEAANNDDARILSHMANF